MPMQPRGPLMIEHRLILRMIALIDEETRKIEKTGVVNQSFIDTAVDFIQTYADRTHHGKEEDILFRELSKKKLSDVDRRSMKELIKDHIFGRTTTSELVKSLQAYRKGNEAAREDITSNLRKFVEFYPKHIEREDQVFFPAAMTYFSEAEQQSMLTEYWEYDRHMIHSKYRMLIEGLEE
jgi:hemerythrin-like domain-containing protein